MRLHRCVQKAHAPIRFEKCVFLVWGQGPWVAQTEKTASGVYTGEEGWQHNLI